MYVVGSIVNQTFDVSAKKVSYEKDRKGKDWFTKLHFRYLSVITIIINELYYTVCIAQCRVSMDNLCELHCAYAAMHNPYCVTQLICI